MRNIIFTLLSTLLIVHSVRSQNPMSDCEGGRGVPNANIANSNGVCNYGEWDSATGVGSTYVAAVNEGFFNAGARCGECFQLYGPLGSVIVTIVDYCASTSDGCSGDAIQFVIDNDAYNQISDDNTGTIEDLGFRQVSCNTTGDLEFQFGTGTSEYYFEVLPFNAKIAVSAVAVKGSGMSSYESLTRNTLSAQWSWNKDSTALSFPASLKFTDELGQAIAYTVDSTPSASQIISASSQFEDVPANPEAVCGQSVAEPILYNVTGTGSGWTYSYSFSVISGPMVASDDSLYAEVGGYGGVQFTRFGGFDPAYWSGLSLTLKASTAGYSSLRVYLGTNYNYSYSIPASEVTTEYTTITIPFSSLNPSATEAAVVIDNNSDQTITLNFEYIGLIRNTSVLENVVPITVPNYALTTGLASTTGTTTSSAETSSTSKSTTGTGTTTSNSNTDGTATTDSDDDTTTTDSKSSTGAAAVNTVCMFSFVSMLAIACLL